MEISRFTRPGSGTYSFLRNCFPFSEAYSKIDFFPNFFRMDGFISEECIGPSVAVRSRLKLTQQVAGKASGKCGLNRIWFLGESSALIGFDSHSLISLSLRQDVPATRIYCFLHQFESRLCRTEGETTTVKIPRPPWCISVQNSFVRNRAGMCLNWWKGRFRESLAFDDGMGIALE